MLRITSKVVIYKNAPMTTMVERHFLEVPIDGEYETNLNT